MSDTALYRKYRPQTFKEVLGQEHIVKVLEGAIKLGNIAHAYVFCGTRGTGKTSIARIFAKAVGTSPTDIYEIDAASHTGVDDIRAINEAVSVLPFESKYKVYIMDEAHMLSKGAFNALLKTLEEPPAHVIFILATTEANKLPDTIISRCQVYNFKKPTHKVLKEVVTRIAKEEGFTLEPASADLIALLGDGSFRDAQGMLQQVIGASKDKKVSVEEVEIVTGAPKSELVNDFIRAIDEQDLELGLRTVRSAGESNIDMGVYFKMILVKFRAIMLSRLSKESREEYANSMTDTDYTFVTKLADSKESKINSKTLLELITFAADVNRSYIKELPLELALIKIVGDK